MAAGQSGPGDSHNGQGETSYKAECKKGSFGIGSSWGVLSHDGRVHRRPHQRMPRRRTMQDKFFSARRKSLILAWRPFTSSIKKASSRLRQDITVAAGVGGFGGCAHGGGGGCAHGGGGCAHGGGGGCAHGGGGCAHAGGGGGHLGGFGGCAHGGGGGCAARPGCAGGGCAHAGGGVHGRRSHRWLRSCGWLCRSPWMCRRRLRSCGWLCRSPWMCRRRLRSCGWLRRSHRWLCRSWLQRLRRSWLQRLCWSWLQRLCWSWLQRLWRLRLGWRVVRNCVLGQCRLHWKLLAMGPVPPSMDQRVLLKRSNR